MSANSEGQATVGSSVQPGGEGDRPPRPGQMPVIVMALSIGLVLMGIQLWLLTVALDLYLAGMGDQVWGIALVSGLIFLGGLLMLWLLDRRPRSRRPPAGDIGSPLP